MKLRWAAVYHGPSPHGLAPVVVAEIICEPAQRERLEVLARRLINSRPEWFSAQTRSELDNALHAKGAFYFACKAALLWAQASLNEVRGYILEAHCQVADPTRILLSLGFHRAEITKRAVQIAFLTLLNGAKTTEAALQRLWQECRRQHPDYQARILMVGATQMNVPVLPFLAHSRFWQFGWGANSRVFMESGSNEDGALGAQWQRSKRKTKEVFEALGLPSPKNVLVSSQEELTQAVEKIGFPCVIKPLEGGGGRGVTANISGFPALLTAFAYGRTFSQGPLMLETHVAGDDHRLMVVRGKLVAAIRREPPFVIGDGTSSISQLLDRLNSKRSSSLVRSTYHRPIKPDAAFTSELARQAVDQETRLELGQKVTLRSNANLSTGGFCNDVTDQVHPAVRQIAEGLASTASLSTAGIDYLTEDISAPPGEGHGHFIEMNATPGLDACVAAGWDEARIAKMVLGSAVDRIPVDVTLVSPERLKEEAAKLGDIELPEAHGKVCSEQIRVGAGLYTVRAAAPWSAVQAALKNKHLAQLEVFTSPSEIIASGYPVDRIRTMKLCDVELPPEWHLPVVESLQVEEPGER